MAMAHLLLLVAGLLVFASTHASDVADRSMHQGFLSQHMGWDASKTSLGDYSKFVIPRFNHMKHGGAPDAPFNHNGPVEHGPATVLDKSAHPTALAQDSMAFTSVRREPLITKDVLPPKIVDEEEERAMQKVFADDNSMPNRMSAIGVALFSFVAMLGVRMRRGLQRATAFASCDGHESDMSTALAPAAAGNILELKTQDFTDVQSLPGILAPTGFFDPAGLFTGFSPSELKCYREAKLTHGRVAMLASLGFLEGESGARPKRFRRLARAVARVMLASFVAIAACFAPAAHAKGGGYGASSAPSSSYSSAPTRSYSSTPTRSYSSTPTRSSYSPAPSTVVIRQPERTYYVGGGGPSTVVQRESSSLDDVVPLVFGGVVGAGMIYGVLAAKSQDNSEAAQRRKRSGGLALYAQELADTKSLMRTLEQDFDSTKAAVQRPVSGQYTGESAEDDEGDQAVVSNLRFAEDGSLKGDGIDGVDGAYTLSGRWSGDRCAWIERYSDGFEVAVTGTVEKSGDIFILFCSSRGISGSADLKLRTAA